jgi:HAD superfamily hydrolase (TIGR01509 family)
VQLPDGDFQGFIYDCDGTLVDSMSLHFRAWREALAAAGAPFDFDWELFTSRAGMTLEQTVVELNQQFGHALHPGRVAAAQRRIFDRLLPEVGPVPEVVLHARAVGDPRVQCVASGSERATVERELVAVGIRQLFGFVVCGEEVERGKPDPEMFLRCADWMGLHPSRCLVFEDSELGIRAARVAGMGWVRVPVRPPG